VIRLKPEKTGIDGIHDVTAGCADIVATGANTAEDLGGNDNVFASDVQILERLSERPFAFAFGVNVGGVEEIDTGLDRGLDEFIRARLVNRADGFPDTLGAAEGHGA
jgi:hypothetical protein